MKKYKLTNENQFLKKEKEKHKKTKKRKAKNEEHQVATASIREQNESNEIKGSQVKSTDRQIIQAIPTLLLAIFHYLSFTFIEKSLFILLLRGEIGNAICEEAITVRR